MPHQRLFPTKLQIACGIMLLVMALNLYFITSLSKCSHDEEEALRRQVEFYRAGMKSQTVRVKDLVEQIDRMNDKARKTPYQKFVPWTQFSPKYPVIFAITPTHSRPVQKAELTRVSQTLLHVSRLHWIVVEDSDAKTNLVASLLASSGLSYTHLNVSTPEKYKMKSSDPNWLKPRGVLQRNLGLKWLRENVDPAKRKGVVYFLDDDNTYSLRVFEEMRSTKKVSVWPVGLVGGLRYESPQVKNGKVTGWFTFWKPERPFAMDMAGFAVNLKLFFDFPKAAFANTVQRGFQESVLLTAMQLTLHDLEPKAKNCTQILVWHTRTEKAVLKNEEWMRKKFGKGSDLKMEV